MFCFYNENRFHYTLIGDLPTAWRLEKIREVAIINSQVTDPSKHFADKQFTYIDIESVENNTGIIRSPKLLFGKEAPSRARRLILKDDVIMSTVRPYLKAFALVPEQYNGQICSTGFAVLTPKKEIIPEYLLITLFSDKTIDQCNKLMVGGQYPAINSSQVGNIAIPLPPIPEQFAIANILLTVNSIIDKTNQIIVKAERLKTFLMHELLTTGIGPHTAFKDTEIGKVPNNWTVEKYKRANEKIFVGIATSSTKYFSNKGIPLIRNQNIKEGRLDLSEVIFIKPEFDASNRSKRLKENDIVTVRTGNPGVSCRITKKEEGWQTFTTLISRPNTREYSSDFLVFVLNSSVAREQIIRLQAGLAQQNLNVSWISNLKIPKPPIEEQNQISLTLKSVVEWVEAEKRIRDKYIQIKDGLANSLLSGRVRVKVN